MGSEIIFEIVFLPIGLAAGYLAGPITRGRRPFDLLGDLMLGMIGGFLGIRFLPAFGILFGGVSVGAFIAALIGAAVVLFRVRLIWRG